MKFKVCDGYMAHYLPPTRFVRIRHVRAIESYFEILLSDTEAKMEGFAALEHTEDRPGPAEGQGGEPNDRDARRRLPALAIGIACLGVLAALRASV